jgi:hypothetical protein
MEQANQVGCKICICACISHGSLHHHGILNIQNFNYQHYLTNMKQIKCSLHYII